MLQPVSVGSKQLADAPPRSPACSDRAVGILRVPALGKAQQLLGPRCLPDDLRIFTEMEHLT